MGLTCSLEELRRASIRDYASAPSGSWRKKSRKPPFPSIFTRIRLIFSSQETIQQPGFTNEQWAGFMALSTKVTSVTCESKLPSDLHALLENHLKTLGPFDTKPFQRVRKFTGFLAETDLWIALLVRDLAPLSSYRLCAHSVGMHEYYDFCFLWRQVVRNTPTIIDLAIDLPDSRFLRTLGSISQLRRVSCRRLKIPDGWWMNLSHCKNLLDLRLEETLKSGEEGVYWDEGLGVATFPVLRRFLLEAREETTIAIILNSRFPVLEHLSFGSRPLPPDKMEGVRTHLSETSPHLRF